TRLSRAEASRHLRSLCGARLSSPEVLKPIRCQLGVPSGVLDVFVAKPSLQRQGIVARVRQGVVAAVAQHVWMTTGTLSCLRGIATRRPTPSWSVFDRRSVTNMPSAVSPRRDRGRLLER